MLGVEVSGSKTIMSYEIKIVIILIGYFFLTILRYGIGEQLIIKKHENEIAGHKFMSMLDIITAIYTFCLILYDRFIGEMGVVILFLLNLLWLASSERMKRK